MPIAYTKNGTPFLEPPYTKAQQDELYQRCGSVAGLARATPPRPKAEPPKR